MKCPEPLYVMTMRAGFYHFADRPDVIGDAKLKRLRREVDSTVVTE